MVTQKSALFFQLLANKYCRGGTNALVRQLPMTLQYKLQRQEATSAKDPNIFFDAANNWVRSVHYSWLQTPLQDAPEPFRKAILGALPHDIASALSSNQEALPLYSEQVRRQILAAFHKLFIAKDPESAAILPKPLLPKTDLDWMLTLSKKEMMELIDLMSMYDLADEVRHVVDRKLLQMIVGRLSQKTQRFLRSCMSQKTKLALAPMHIEHMYRDEAQFRTRLHKRGIQRLSIALSGQGVDFIWYILHTLDIGRGTLLMKQIQKEAQPTTPAARMQLLVTLQYMKDVKKQQIEAPQPKSGLNEAAEQNEEEREE